MYIEFMVSLNLKVMGTAIKFISSLDLPYVSMYVKQDNVKPSFFELLKRQIRNQRRSHQKECVDRR